jgi:multidrug efflux pump subunit AcrA (membrane-fusion protein)
VQGLIDNPNQLLKAGMFATATVSLPPKADLVIVPTSALIDQGDRTVVYVQSPKGLNEFLRRAVEVTERLKSEAFLAGGVRPNEKVVTRGALELDQ